MLRKGLICIFLIMLCGCVKAEGFREERLRTELDAAAAEPVMPANYGKEYYSYYLQPGIGRRQADRVSNLFVWNGEPFYMTLDIASLINERYYSGQSVSEEHPDDSQLVCRLSGNLTAEENSGTYTASVYRIGDRFCVMLRGGSVTLAGYTEEAFAARMAAEMLRIARTVTVDRNAVTAAFSRKELITYKAKKVELFTDIAPENGEIEELFSDHYSAGNTVPEGENAEKNFAE